MNKNMAILIVDDSMLNIKVLSEMLDKEGYNVRIAVNGEEAIESVKIAPPDLILMDVQMPVMDGYEACKQIKAMAVGKMIPIIFISVMSKSFSVVKAFEVGANDYIRKPFKNIEVLARVKMHLDLFAYQRHLQGINMELYKQFRSTFDQAAVGIVYAHPSDGGFIRANNRFCTMLGYSSKELLEMKIEDIIHPDYIDQEIEIIQKLLKNIDNSYTHVFLMKRKDNKYMWIKVTATLVQDDSGEPDYVVSILEDITERKEAEENLRTSEKRLKEAQALSKIGCWELDLVSNQLYWSDEIYSIFDVDPSQFKASYEAFVETIHPEDREKVNRAYTKHIENKSAYDIEHRILLKDGAIKYVHENCHSTYDENGNAIKSIGTVQDITEKKLAEGEILKLNRELEDRVIGRTRELENEKVFTDKVINSLPGIFFMLNEEGLLLRWNSNYQNLIGRNAMEMEQSKLVDIVAESDKETIETIVKDITDEGYKSYEVHIHSHNDRSIPYFITSSRLRMGDQDFLVGVGFDITDRKKMENKLKVATDKAVQATKAKSEFLANMSHEIRTPMNAVIGMSHLALKTDLTPKQRDYVSKIGIAGQNLLGIINEILDFSKIEAGKLSVECVEFDLNDVITNLSSILSIKAQDKGLELIFDMDMSIPNLLVGDPLRLGQVLLNLANNAVKFTDVGEIIVRIEKLKKNHGKVRFRFSVIDTGIGLTEEQQSKLFNSFEQADSSTTRQYGGSGLGLTISKSIVEMMGGKIEFESTYQKGSTFSFEVDFEIQSVQSELPIDSITLPIGMKAVVIEDNKTTAMVISHYLTDYGFNVDIAYNDEEALELLKDKLNSNARLCDVALVDWKLPGIDGFEAIKEIRTLLNGRRQPVFIVLTNHGREDIMRQAKALEVDGFLIKPVTQSILLDTIMRSLGHEIARDHTPLNGTIRMPDGFDKIRGARILLAEDNEINQQVAKEILEGEGFYVEIAGNGHETIEKVLDSKQSYDLILMDLQMPVVDGYEATRRIRESISHEVLPIVAMTADAMKGVRKRILSSGMDDYVPKPIDPNNLFSVMTKWIKSAKRPLPELNIDLDPEAMTLENLPFTELTGINIDSGLSRITYNNALYLKLLRSFYDNNQNTLHELKVNILENDFKEARRIAHTTKGVAKLIGANKLVAVSKEMEEHLLHKRIEMIYELLTQFEVCIDEVLSSLEPYMENENSVFIYKEAGTDEQLLEILKGLKPFVTNRNFTMSKKLSTQLVEKSWGYLYEGRVQNIFNEINRYNFDDANEAIVNVINKVECHTQDSD